MNFFTKYWKWVLAAMVLCLFSWQYLSGWAQAKKYYNIALDQLRDDKTEVVRTLEETVTAREKELAEIEQKLAENAKQQAAIRVENQQLRGLLREKNDEILALKKERELIVVPTNPDALVDEFRKRGYKPRVVLPSR